MRRTTLIVATLNFVCITSPSFSRFDYSEVVFHVIMLCRDNEIHEEDISHYGIKVVLNPACFINGCQ